MLTSRCFPVLALLAAISPAFAQSAPDLKFSFGPQPVAGYTQVKPENIYTRDAGFGFDLGSKVRQLPTAITDGNNRGFFFSARLAPGAYRVTVTLGGPAEATTTVKSETRRLHIESLHTDAGKTETRSFLVHVRIPQIPAESGGGGGGGGPSASSSANPTPSSSSAGTPPTKTPPPKSLLPNSTGMKNSPSLSPAITPPSAASKSPPRPRIRPSTSSATPP